MTADGAHLGILVTATDQSALHIGRAWTGHALEDDCPCPKAACGLVLGATVDATCPQHALTAGKTIRQAHVAERCPALLLAAHLARCETCDFIGPSRPMQQLTRDFHRAFHRPALAFLAALTPLAWLGTPRQDDYVLTGYRSNHARGRAVDTPANFALAALDEFAYHLHYTPAERRRRARRRAREAAKNPAQTALWAAYRHKTRRRNRRRNR